MYLAYMRISRAGGNHQRRTRVASGTYPLSYKYEPGQALQCSMGMDTTDIAHP